MKINTKRTTTGNDHGAIMIEIKEPMISNIQRVVHILVSHIAKKSN